MPMRVDRAEALGEVGLGEGRLDADGRGNRGRGVVLQWCAAG